MPRIFLSLLFAFVIFLFNGHCQSLTFESNVTFSEDAADIWGYVDTSGVEYAVIGTRTATRIYSLEDPSNPIERAVIAGDATDWRDMKSFGNYIYSVQDVHGNDGLVVIDMSQAPNSITHTFWTPTLTVDGVTAQLEQCHNLYVDDAGYLYMAGTNIASGGVIICDINTSNGIPVYVGAADDRYAHDVYVRDSLMYASEIYAGIFSIYDITDRANPTLLGTQATGRDFTHNAWLSDDGNTLFTTDEKSNAYVEAYDVSDPTDIVQLDRWRPTAGGTGVIPHNAHVLNDYLVISYYRDGVYILDAAQPDNLIEIAQYDTYGGSGNGFNGCWGAFPFLPSGLVLASDIESGLYVLTPEYKRASYFRGQVRDAVNGNTIVGATINIVAHPDRSTTSDNFGNFATGVVDSANFMIVTTATGYTSDTMYVDLHPGVNTERTIYLGGPCIQDSQQTGTLSSGFLVVSNTITASDAVLANTEVAEWQANTSVGLESNVTIEVGAELLIDNNGCD